MSVTFRVENMRGEAISLACDGCGKRADDGLDYTVCQVEGCLGYGPDMLYSGRGPEMNVANGNAISILRDLLGLPVPRDLCGELDPTDLLLRLAMAGSRVHNVVRPTTVSRETVVLTAEGVDVRQGPTVIECGVSPRQADSCVERLRVIAEKARDMGRTVLFD